MNSALFKYYVARAGLTLAKVSETLGIDASTLHRKINGITDFTRAEILFLRQCLHLSLEESERLFFNQDFAKTQKEREETHERTSNF